MTHKNAKKQILIIEDNKLNREMLKEILSEEYNVLEAENGLQALDLLKRHKDVILILLDVVMPMMDGYVFLDILKENKELSLIPVIVMTQSDKEEDELLALSHGAIDFVPKPYRPRIILHRVASIIKLRETASLVYQFKYDRLTGLYSKEFFYQKVREILDEDPNHKYYIICSNIENFKLYNDSFGQKAGDELLKSIASKAKAFIGEKGICSRYSADRFLYFQKCEQVRKDCQSFFHKMETDYANTIENVSMKWGIYEIVDSSVPVEHMCDRAMLAVDSIKGQYNKHYSIYDDALRSKLLREKAITDAMETALKKEQFIVYFQPKYSLNDKCISGAEALVRWIHPQWGFMSPDEFIPLFEKNGFIPRLDQYVWQQACKQMKEWRDKGYPPITISVNVSRADIYQSQFIETLLNLVQKYDINPKYLHLEITESAYTENPNQMMTTIEKLRHLGFIVEMDDFGKGYSSLNMLSHIQLDILKLDMNFIHNELNKQEDQSVLNNIVNMAHKLRLSVVAEGVENRQQLERLASIGCDYVQGYFFAKPMPAAEFEDLMKTQHPHSINPTPQYFFNTKHMRKVLVVDDDVIYRKKVLQIFAGKYHVLEAVDVKSALSCIQEYGYDDISMIILSMTLPENGAEALLELLKKNPLFWEIPILSTIPNGEMMGQLPLALETDDFLCKCHPIVDLHRRVDQLIKIRTYRERERALQNEASRDYLTGLLNRRGLEAAMNSLRKEELPIAVYLFDLDNLKEVNDTRGHDMGDRLIQSFADLLRRQTRAEDIQCRYGGDEFVVILKYMKDGASALKKGEDICRLFQKYFQAEHIFAGCSCGIALCGVHEKPSATLIDHADQALYVAKREHKGSCALWDKDLQS